MNKKLSDHINVGSDKKKGKKVSNIHRQQEDTMSKTRNKNSDMPVEKASYSTGTRGESAFSRNQSGNHHGDRHGATKTPSNGKKANH